MEETQGEPQIQTEQLVDVGNLVYSYDLPSDVKNAVRPKKDSSESDESDDDENDAGVEVAFGKLYNSFQKQESSPKKSQQNKSRSPRSAGQRQSKQSRNQKYQNNDEDESIDMEQEFYQPKPTLKDAPQNPLLNYFIGNKGQSIQNRRGFNAQNEVQKLAEEIAQDLDNVSQMPVKYTLRKFNVLVKVIRTMNAEQMEETTRALEQNGNGNDQQTSEKIRKVYRDALLSAGTGPAINELMQWIEEGKLKGEEAAEVIAAFPKTIRAPTEEMQQRFFVS